MYEQIDIYLLDKKIRINRLAAGLLQTHRVLQVSEGCVEGFSKVQMSDSCLIEIGS